MIKKLLLTVCCALTAYLSIAQPPSFYRSWDKRYGGDKDDAIVWFEKTSDGGLILAGTSLSGISGDKSEANHDSSHQTSDFWLIKTDAAGVKLWDKRLGGNNSEIAGYGIQTNDGGFLAGGTTFSGIGGEKSEPNWDPTELSNDYWIIRTDASGNKIWDKRFGGDSFELFGNVKQTPDGGFIICGSSFSEVSGDKTEPSQGSWDYWIVRTDASGIKLWDKRFGGTGDDFSTTINLAPTGGFIIGGYSISEVGGDKSQPSQGSWDYWIIRIDDQGTLLWEKTFGGNDTDWLFDMIPTSDNGFLLGGQSFSEATGDKSEPNHDPTTSGSDRWIVKTDANGNKLWDRTFGGDQPEDLSRVMETPDGGFLISGESYSGANGNKTEPNLGPEQTWIVKTDNTGILEWDKTIFSYGHDEKGTAILFDSLCIITVNYTTADTGGYKTEFTQGNGDYWITKICMDDPSGVTDQNTTNHEWNMYPNPSTGQLFIRNQFELDDYVSVEITDVKGRIVFQTVLQHQQSKEVMLDILNLSGGIYYCRINTEKKSSVLKFSVVH